MAQSGRNDIVWEKDEGTCVEIFFKNSAEGTQDGRVAQQVGPVQVGAHVVQHRQDAVVDEPAYQDGLWRHQILFTVSNPTESNLI